jgi:hypothetical protein
MDQKYRTCKNGNTQHRPINTPVLLRPTLRNVTILAIAWDPCDRPLINSDLYCRDFGGLSLCLHTKEPQPGETGAQRFAT